MHIGGDLVDNIDLMKRTSVISPVLLLTITAAVGAGYLPADDPMQLMGRANSSAMVSVRTQRHAARQWLEHVVKTFGSNHDHRHATPTTCLGDILTKLPALHLSSRSHVDRIRRFDQHQQTQDWLLNLPPPSMI